MEAYVYVLLREHIGYNTYEGLFRDFQTAKNEQRSGLTILSEKIDTLQLIDNIIYVAQWWDVAANTHIYNGVYPSYEIAKKNVEFLGGKGMISQHDITLLK